MRAKPRVVGNRRLLNSGSRAFHLRLTQSAASMISTDLGRTDRDLRPRPETTAPIALPSTTGTTYPIGWAKYGDVANRGLRGRRGRPCTAAAVTSDCHQSGVTVAIRTSSTRPSRWHRGEHVSNKRQKKRTVSILFRSSFLVSRRLTWDYKKGLRKILG